MPARDRLVNDAHGDTGGHTDWDEQDTAAGTEQDPAGQVTDTQVSGPVDTTDSPKTLGFVFDLGFEVSDVRSNSLRGRVTCPRAGETPLRGSEPEETDEKPQRRTGPATRWHARTTPTSRRDMLLAAETLWWDENLTLRRCTPKLLRHLLRPYFAAGWTIADVRHAMNHMPDGQHHRWTTPPQHPDRWLRWRLGQWRVDGTILPPRSARTSA